MSRVRFLLGDTNTANPEVQDETIEALIYQQGLSEKWAAAKCARSICAKYARFADTTMDDQLTRYSHVHKAWLTLATQLEAEAAAESGPPGVVVAPGAGPGLIIVTGLDDHRGPLSGPCDRPDWLC